MKIRIISLMEGCSRAELIWFCLNTEGKIKKRLWGGNVKAINPDSAGREKLAAAHLWMNICNSQQGRGDERHAGSRSLTVGWL